MKFFINLNIRKKLILVFSVICIFMGLIGVEGILSSVKINEGSKDIYSNHLMSIEDLEEIKGNINDMRANLLRIVFERDKSKLDDQIKAIEDSTKKDNLLMEEYGSLPSSSEENKTYDDFKSELVKYRETRTTVIELAKANNYEDTVNIYNSKMPTIRQAMFEKLDKCIEMNKEYAKQQSLDNIAQFNKSRNTIITYTAIAFLIIIFMLYILNKNIIDPLNKIKEFAVRLSNYDFSTPIIITRKDEFGQTGTALNTAQENVSSLVKVIMENSQDISASSEELSATVQELSSKVITIDQAVDTIASGMQESSAATEEISASIQALMCFLLKLWKEVIMHINLKKELQKLKTIAKMLF